MMEHIQNALQQAEGGRFVSVGMELADLFECFECGSAIDIWDAWMEFWDYVEASDDHPYVMEFLDYLSSPVPVTLLQQRRIRS